jgi:hypothetical protein
MWKDFSESFEEAFLAFVYWGLLLSLDGCDDSYIERREFWEQLSLGWMREYIWPYDDIYGVTRMSHERKMRIGR